MPAIKQIPRSAAIAFSPNAAYIAAGTVAGAIDSSFSTTSTLEVFPVDFASASAEATPLGGPVTASERFHRIAWGSLGAGSEQIPLGVVAGGLSDGSIHLWNPKAIVEGYSDEGTDAVLSRLTKHTGAVKGLEFNSFSPNLLASGAADGELCIWDLADTANPSPYPAMRGGTGGVSDKSEITHLAWNSMTQHILATCTVNGSIIIWDLKRQKPLITFRDPGGRRRCSAVAWNPSNARQLVVASEDDAAPALHLWDLRNVVSPYKELVSHSKGVLGVAWCKQDPGLLLSSGKDNRTICWDVQTSSVLCELPASENWNFDVQWSPTTPGIFATASFDGKVGVYSLDSCSAAGSTEVVNADFSISSVPTGGAAPLQRAPMWLRRPVSATFGFGGKLAAVTSAKRQLPTGEVLETGKVTISQVVTEDDLVRHSEEFERAVASAEPSALVSFCQAKEEMESGADKEDWSFLRCLYSDPQEARSQLLAHLGFEDQLPKPPEPARAADIDAAAASLDELNLQAAAETPKQDLGQLSDGSSFFDHAPDDGGAFFDHLPTLATPPRTPLTPTAISPSASPTAAGAPETPGEAEDDILKSLYVGNYAAAVDHCIRVGRMADAMVIGHMGGSALHARAEKAYMRHAPRPFMHIVQAVMDSNLRGLVNSRPVAAWKETLAIVTAYSDSGDSWSELCDSLAHKLEAEGMPHEATLCWICCANTEKVVQQWLKAANGSAVSVDVLQRLTEKAVVLGLARPNPPASPALSNLISQYAGLLAAQGRMATALEYLEMVPGEASSAAAVLRDRIFRSGGASIPPNIAPPPFPFVAEDVQAAAAPAADGYVYENGVEYYRQPPGTYDASYGSYAQPGYDNSYYAGQQPAASYGAGTQGGGYAAAQPAAPAAYTPAPAAPQVQPIQPFKPAPSQPAPYERQRAGAPYPSSYEPQPTVAPYQAPPAPQPAPYERQPAGAPYPSSFEPQPKVTPYQAPPASQPAPYDRQPAGAPYPSTYEPQSKAAPYQPTQGTLFQPSNPAASAPPVATQAVQPPAYQQQPSYSAQPPQAPYQTPQSPAPTAAYEPYTGYQQSNQAPVNVFQPTKSAAPAAAAPPAPQLFVPHRAAPGMATQPPQGQSFAPQQRVSPSPSPTAAMPVAAAFGPPMGSGPVPQPPQAAPPPAPTGPPTNINVQNAVTNEASPEMQGVVRSLTSLFNVCNAVPLQAGKKREMDDNSKRLGVLFWHLNKGDVSPNVQRRLVEMAAALDAGDFGLATQIQVALTTSDWDECSTWLTALKRLIKFRQTLQ